jgi:acyl-CoA reductase-like NAD-dependent aldehyde dehydrogenase
MKRLLLELGGKGAAIVFDDADVKTAITGITSVWAFHSGQICTAPTRVLAQRGVYDQLVAGLQAAAGPLKVGDPLRARHRARPGHHRGPPRPGRGLLMRSGSDEGGTIVTGGERPDIDGKGFYVAPTLIADCKPDMRVVQQEIFGPVMVVVPSTTRTKPSLANSTEFGLYDYVFSSDTGRPCEVAKQLRTGNVGINTVQRNHEAPFGGFKMSGVGRDGGSLRLPRLQRAAVDRLARLSAPPGRGQSCEGFCSTKAVCRSSQTSPPVTCGPVR